MFMNFEGGARRKKQFFGQFFPKKVPKTPLVARFFNFACGGLFNALGELGINLVNFYKVQDS